MRTHIVCKNQEEMDAVLKRLEKEGFRWADGSKATEYNPPLYNLPSENEPLCLTLSPNGIGEDLIRWVSKPFGGCDKEYTATEYLAKAKKNKPILIYRKGRAVYAEDKNTGIVGTSICSPDDTFDFYTGAMIALCRLVKDNISNDAKAEMRKILSKESESDTDEIKVGDTVMVVDDGACYSRYDTWVKDNVTNIIDCIQYCYGKSIPAEMYHRYTVIAIGPHGRDSKVTLYYIKNITTEECFLMGKWGIEKV